MDAVLQEERYRDMLEKSLCSLVCTTVQHDPKESWSSYWKKPLWLHDVTRDLWPYKTIVVLQLQLSSLRFRTDTGGRCAVSFEGYYDRK